MILDIAEDQLASGMAAARRVHSDFFNEFSRHFDTSSEFDAEVEGILAATDRDKTFANIRRLHSEIQELVPRLADLVGEHEVSRLKFATIIGRGTWDGHALMMNDEPVVFFDMTLMNEHLSHPGFELETHVLHEMVHGLHYASQPAFYFAAHGTFAEGLRKRMIAEGVATYLSHRLSGVSAAKALWFGYLDDTRYRRWSAVAEEKRQSVWFRSQEPSVSKETQESLEEQLLYLPDGIENPNGRLAYYYGYHLATSLSEGISAWELLTLPLAAYEAALLSYFSQ